MEKVLMAKIDLLKSIKKNVEYLSEILEKDFLKASTSLSQANVFVNEALEELEYESKK
jgi:hypothetical protein